LERFVERIARDEPFSNEELADALASCSYGCSHVRPGGVISRRMIESIAGGGESVCRRRRGWTARR